MTFNSPFAAIAPSKKPLDTVSRGQLVSRGLMGGGGCSSCALGSTSGTYKTKDLMSVVFEGANSFSDLEFVFVALIHVKDFLTHRFLLGVKGFLQSLSFFIKAMSGSGQVRKRLWKQSRKAVIGVCFEPQWT